MKINRAKLEARYFSAQLMSSNGNYLVDVNVFNFDPMFDLYILLSLYFSAEANSSTSNKR